ncbi:hypothetical protein [Corynebacterium sp. 13CS0277]|nr:hypothetical protein [Corynebacterium sp. 13CS0277]
MIGDIVFGLFGYAIHAVIFGLALISELPGGMLSLELSSAL